MEDWMNYALNKNEDRIRNLEHQLDYLTAELLRKKARPVKPRQFVEARPAWFGEAF